MLNDMIVLLLIANQGYQPIEYGHTRKMLEEAGVKVEVASNIKQTAQSNPNQPNPTMPQQKTCGCNKAILQYQTAQVDYELSEVNPDKYNGIFIIGGPGALEALNNQTTYNIMQKIAQSGKPFGAICISPRILASAGLLDGKKATGWNGDNKLNEFFKEHNVTYVKQSVVVDGSLITADGPISALVFGRTIVDILSNKPR